MKEQQKFFHSPYYPKTEAASRGAGQLIAKVVQWKGNGLTDSPKSFALIKRFVKRFF